MPKSWVGPLVFWLFTDELNGKLIRVKNGAL